MRIRAWHLAKSIVTSIGILILASAPGPAAAAQSPSVESAIQVSGSGGETYVLITGLMGGTAGFCRLEPLGDRLRIERVPGAGHFVHEEAPALVATLLSPRSMQEAAASLQPSTR